MLQLKIDEAARIKGRRYNQPGNHLIEWGIPKYLLFRSHISTSSLGDGHGLIGGQTLKITSVIVVPRKGVPRVTTDLM